MPPIPDRGRLDSLLELFRARLEPRPAELLTAFARPYLEAIPPEDLAQLQPEDLYGLLLGHWQLAEYRAAGTPRVRLYNPIYEDHGWQSPHTVVEVVTEDMPFLVDSLRMAVQRQRLRVHRIIHPVIRVRRDRHRRLTGIVERGVEGADLADESFIHLETDRIVDRAELRALEHTVRATLRDVAHVVEDWPAMRQRMGEAIGHLEKAGDRLPTPAEDIREVLAFLRWLDEGHFTYVAFREFRVTEVEGRPALSLVPDSGLGTHRLARQATPWVIPESIRAAVMAPEPLILTKSVRRSTVHRPAHLDYVGVKRFDARGRPVGEWRFQGLYASAAYDAMPEEIPLLRRKLTHVLKHAAADPDSHAGRALRHILHNLPRDELIQATPDEVCHLALGILHMEERPRLRLFVRRDRWLRFVSALVFVPRERYDTALRRRLQGLLTEAYGALEAEFDVYFSESSLARVYFVLRTDPQTPRRPDPADLERRLAEATLSWEDRLAAALRAEHGEAEARRLFRRWASALPAAYRDDYTPQTAVADIQRLEAVAASGRLATHLHRPPGADALRLKVFGKRRPLPLSDVLPVLENMGVRVEGARPYRLRTDPGGDFWMLNFEIRPAARGEVDVLAVEQDFRVLFTEVVRGRVENDPFNALVLAAGLRAHEIPVLRAVGRFLSQARVPFSLPYMAQALLAHPQIAQGLVQRFHARFDPDLPEETRPEQEATAARRVLEAIDAVDSLDQDRILRAYLEVIQAAVRTNFYREPRTVLAFKLDAGRLSFLPPPRPTAEIFVHAPHVEGTHLRGGRIARGGLRWSDRQEDFRTEVLGLMKAQMVKNVVIVPTGAKGGFVVRGASAPAAGGPAESGRRAYTDFVGGLLDLTDDLREGDTVPPQRVVRHDGDDPYLVVAADKGTAGFSDLANEVAEARGFWLRDAFATGGRHGYDHKRMGITARGAWESVRRHFRELGRDVDREPFTVVGIGDPSGDVFGNGMLLSRHIRLVAAFNHRAIFLDPEPDEAASFQERKRLFEAGLDWLSYDSGAISSGGGIYRRNAKRIKISAQAAAAIGSERRQFTPAELIRAILVAPVDLLWNGGIGTYVKASDETHAAIGDRANDAVRVNASELRCKVVAEGGNLGFSQRARVEFARAGGKINTDAIDNSGGVDCSDHEVNIKILLHRVMDAGELTLRQRNRLLEAMTDEVAASVLRNNYLQTQSISITEHEAPAALAEHRRLLYVLEREGRLDRRLEGLPGDEELSERAAAGEGLTRPEIAVLLAYGKMRLDEQLRSAPLLDDPALQCELHAYFPPTLRARFASWLADHPLRTEIVATRLANGMLNRMGSSFALRMEDETGAAAVAIARAYVAAREIFDMEQTWSRIEALDNTVAAAVQLDLLADTRRLIERVTRWFLRHHPGGPQVHAAVRPYRRPILALQRELTRYLPQALRERVEARAAPFVEAGVPEPLARHVAGLQLLASGLDIARIARRTSRALGRAAAVYFEIATRLELDRIADRIYALPRRDHWSRAARALLFDELADHLERITADCLRHAPARAGPRDAANAWAEARREALERYQRMLADLRAAAEPDLAMLNLAMRYLETLGRPEPPGTQRPA